jgi:hypothetical protein
MLERLPEPLVLKHLFEVIKPNPSCSLEAVPGYEADGKTTS